MIARYLACALALIAPTTLGIACKGGGGSVGEFITIVQTSPAEGDTNVNVATRIGFQVSDGASIDPDTFNGDTFYLTDEDGNVITGETYTVGGDEDDGPDVAVMELAAPLDVITRYTATITTGLVASGATLEQDFEWSFTTVDSEWGESEWLESVSTGVSRRPRIVVNAELNAFAVWEYDEEAGTSVWTNRYTRTDLWGTPAPLDNGPGAERPAIAADAMGNAFAVWQRSDDGGFTANIYANRYEASTGWGTTSVLLQTGDVTPARAPSIAADPSGNAIAIWLERDTDTQREVVTASRYEPASGWSEPERIEELPANLLAGSNTAIDMDGDGNAIAVWARPTVDGSVLWSNRYTVGSGWGTAELIKTDTETDARDPRLDVGANGDAFVIWLQNDADRQDVWSTRYSSGSWSAPARIDNYDAEDKREPDIAVDGSGVAHAVWSQVDPDFANIWANQYTPGTGWGDPELIEPPRRDEEGNLDPDEDGDAATPRVEVNSAGNVFVVWRQIWQDWASVWSNRRDPDSEWVGALLIEDLPRSAKGPIVAVDENRHAHAVWLHSIDSGVDWVRTNRFE
jgi:hypothetical protein